MLTICQALQCVKELPMLCFQPLQQLSIAVIPVSQVGDLLINALLEVKLGFRRLGVNSGGLIPKLAVLTTTILTTTPHPHSQGTMAWKVKKPTRATNIYCLQPKPSPVHAYIYSIPLRTLLIHSTNVP